MSGMWLNSGRLVDPTKIEDYPDLTIEELMHPICLLPGYAGQTIAPYTVGEHTCHLIDMVPQPLKRAVALHDLNEGLTTDLPRPIKAEMPAFCSFEEKVQRHIFNLFNEPWENMLAIAEYDTRICADEMPQIFKHPYNPPYEPLGVKIRFWPWHEVKHELSDRFKELGLLS